jgi:hypothetical protein
LSDKEARAAAESRFKSGDSTFSVSFQLPDLTNGFT